MVSGLSGKPIKDDFIHSLIDEIIKAYSDIECAFYYVGSHRYFFR